LPRKVNLAWTRGLEGEPKKRFEEQLLSNHKIFEQLDKILLEMKQKTEVKLDDYTGDWSHKQAHRNGMNEAYDQVQKLIRTLIEDDHTL